MHRIETKYWVRAVGIAVVGIVAAAAASSSCVFDSRTNFCEQFGVRCKEGQQCALHQAVCIDIGGCGDGRVEPDKGEVCDDGNIQDGDGCSADCTSDESCGNHIIDTNAAIPESCDDGNHDARDGCSPDCQIESKVCGNFVIDRDIGEICDDGNTKSGDGCSPDCKSNEACGNGQIDNDGPDGVLHEECDPEDRFPLLAEDTDKCNSDCTLPVCGDGHTNIHNLVPDSGSGHLEQCDNGVMGVPTDSPGCDSDCTFASCGDGHANHAAGEDCDPGTKEDSQACDSDCTLPRCGDKHINPNFKPPESDFPEVCDMGEDTQTCDSDCSLPACGDGHMNSNFIIPGSGHAEECDGGSVVNGVVTPKDTMTCDFDCTLAKCGDGHMNAAAGEACDDGNQVNTDGCPDGAGGTCKPATCGDGFIHQGVEMCDDGNHSNTDSCPDGPGGTCKPAVCGDGFVHAGVEECEPTVKPDPCEGGEHCQPNCTCG